MRITQSKAVKPNEHEAPQTKPIAPAIPLEQTAVHLKPTLSVLYFVSSASRPSIRAFYDQLATQGVIPPSFPHDQAVHSGIFIYDHSTGSVVDLIEGSGNRNGQLVLYRNRASTIAKLENSSTLPGSDKSVSVYGFWTQAYKIKTHLATTRTKKAIEIFDHFFDEFNRLSIETPIRYIPGKVDCQTCTHHLLHLITGKEHASPHGEYTLGRGHGTKSPHEVFEEITAAAANAVPANSEQELAKQPRS